MFKTLSAKLSVVLLGLLCLIGGLYISLTLFSTQLYLQEVNQELNRTLARNLVSQNMLTEAGQANQEAMEKLFHNLMVINPSIEIYLLDPAGKILACSAPVHKLKKRYVALEPIKDFLDERKTLPILGDDPQDVMARKAFSVAPIPAKTATEGVIGGYLYVVLASKAYSSAAQMLQGSYILRLSTGVIAASLLLTLIAGLLLFKYITRRLTHLSHAMEDFKRSDFVESAQAVAINSHDIKGEDEIARLGVTFNQMAERILQQMQTLKKTDQLRRELVANVSHDLRTPLASLQGYLETLLLKEGKLSEDEQRNYLEVALRHSERLGKLVTELFELAKLDSQVIPLALEPFALGELVHDVVQELQLAAEKKGITLQASIEQDLAFVYADIGLIERVLENLIENALRYTMAGGTITIAVTVYVQAVRVQVTDTGSGIPAEDLPHIFERFYRVEKSRQNSGSGAGLGLAIAKRILELHGSSIAVTSVVNKGTTFSFDLAVAKA